jgi:hypothetical protein
MSATGSGIDEWITTGYRRTLLREPRPEEVAALSALYREQLEAMQRDPEAARKLATEPLGPPPEGSDLPKLAALTTVANVILNLDEFLTKP